MPYSSKEKRNQHRLENKDRYNKNARKGYWKNKEFRRQYASEYYHKYQKVQRHEEKIKLFDILGGRKCVQCGFDDERALQFDHVAGNGYAEERKHKGYSSGRSFYRKYSSDPELAKNTLQVLCANCNWIKRHINNEFRKR